MKTALHELISAWRSMPLSTPPFVLPGDEAIVGNGRCYPYRTYADFISDPEFGRLSPTQFHTGLLPMPYSGDITRAQIYILALNPGFTPRDYYAESMDRSFRQERTCQLKQQNLDDKFPWSPLNPAHLWSSDYWSRRFRDMAVALAEQRKISFSTAISRISCKTAVLEFVPYHSKSFGIPSNVLDQLRSPKLMFRFVHDYVVPRAKQDKAIVIVTRQVKRWNLPKHKNIITYTPAQARSAHLNLKSPGGKAIAKKLKINI
jgi:hypothetical protein